MKGFKASLALFTAASAFISSASLVQGEERELTVDRKDDALQIKKIASYDSGSDEGGTEILAYDIHTKKAFVTNSAKKSIDIVDFSTLNKNEDLSLKPSASISLKQLGIENADGITSVATHPKVNFIAAAVPSSPKQENGYVVLLDKEGKLLTKIEVGALPDNVVFTPDGETLLTANEGEPSSDYKQNPEGSVSIINVKEINNLKKEEIGKADIKAINVSFQDVPIRGEVRKNSKGTLMKQLEPEYITVDEESEYAYVSLQENNAIAKLNLKTQKFDEIVGLGVKDHSLKENALDGMNNGKINIEPLPVLGMYQPDALDYFQKGNKGYIVTPNEGDARDYEAYGEEKTIKELLNSGGKIELNAKHYKGFTQEEINQMVQNGLFNEKKLGDLKVSIEEGKNKDGVYESLYSFGGRSFSIWDAETLEKVYDSGSQFEDITARVYPETFNSSNDKVKLDNRSDDKGPEPEAAEVGKIGGQTYAFIGLERMGGVMVYNISNPTEAHYTTYFSSRDMSEDVKEDSAPEGITFIDQKDSPTKTPLLIVSNEVSGTVALYEIEGKAKEFKDIPKTHWAYTYIQELVEKGIVDGKEDGTFSPQEDVTRAQFAKIVKRALNVPSVSHSAPFKDVPEWVNDDVNALYEAGIIQGKTKEVFAPEQSITRQQMALVIMRAYEWKKGKLSHVKQAPFKDRETISEEAQEKIDALYTLGVMSGKNSGNFSPYELSSRAQAAKVLSKLLSSLE
jgi:hypothetical protein